VIHNIYSVDYIYNDKIYIISLSLSSHSESPTYAAVMLYSEQIRAARGLLSWSQGELARASRVGLATIQRIESKKGPAMGNVSTVIRIQQAFERAGIRFTDANMEGGIGVRLKSAKAKKPGR
jgi:hypothetical protein